MKKFVFVLMALLAAFMFFTCGGGDPDKPDGPDGPDGPGGPVLPATLELGAGEYYTFPSTQTFTLDISDDDSYTVEVVKDDSGNPTKKIFGAGAIGSATVFAKDAAGTELAKCVVTIKPISLTLDLNPINWGPLPANLNNNAGAETAYATTSFESGVLTLTFNKNRQRGAIPITAAQEQILKSEFSRLKKSVTFRIDATVTVAEPKPAGYDYFTAESAGFRLHIADPSVTWYVSMGGNGNVWNATTGSGIMEGPFPHQPEYRAFDHAFDVLDLPPDENRSTKGYSNGETDGEILPEKGPWSNFKVVFLQAMFKNADGTSGLGSNPDYPVVKVAIKSIKIEIGDTRTAAEKPQE